MRRFTLLMPLFMQLFISRILLLSLCLLCPVLLYRRPDLFQAAVSLALAASEGVLVDLERVGEDALRDRGNERVVLVVERVFGLDDMRGEMCKQQNLASHQGRRAWRHLRKTRAAAQLRSHGGGADLDAKLHELLG